jgi:hypothetical protein
MPNLTSAPRAALTKAKAKPRVRRGRPRRRNSWWMAIKVAFLVERFRRRQSKEGSSSPSPRQIALVVVSAGLAILVVRVASQRVRSRGAGAQAETQPDNREASSTPSISDNDTGLANTSSLTDAVQSEMARRDDTSTAATGAD